MGFEYSIARTNQFWVKNLNDFKRGLDGYIGGECENNIRYHYSDYKRKSKKALIDLSSEDFCLSAWKRGAESEETLNILEYVKTHIAEDDKCVIHLVNYEHAADMSITKYVITSEDIKEYAIID